jgi:cytochrome c peroxidase
MRVFSAIGWMLLIAISTTPLHASESSWRMSSASGLYQLTLQPRSGHYVFDQFHDWMVHVNNQQQQAVADAHFTIDGGMAAHGHGLPSQPKVTTYLGNGDYLIEGMLFNMTGTWTLVLNIDSAVGSDQARFELNLNHQAEDAALELTQWTPDELQILRSLSLKNLPPVPPDVSNRYADDPQAQALGKQLFFDTQFSANGKLSCASCHQPQRAFTDGLPHAVGVHATGRNTQTIIAAAWSRWFYWDGRRDSLWAQALVPFEAADEMGGSRVAVVRRIGEQKNYRQAYEEVFGAFPAVILTANLPKNAGPLGDQEIQNNWYKIPADMQNAINQVYSRLGKAVAAYERTLLPQPTRFDVYVEQLLSGKPVSKPLLKNEIAGLKLFIDAKQTQCLQCHNGPLFSNGDFHNIGSGNFSGDFLDFGRSLGLQSVVMDEFNCLGRFSDAKPDDCQPLRFLNKSAHIPLQGAYKTPSLRYAKNTAPYFHDGRFKQLLEVMRYYNNPPQNNGPHELKPLNLTDQQLLDLVAFMQTLGAADHP